MSQTGECKHFNARTGFGFIIQADGTDLFVHIQDCTDGMCPQKGDILSYDVGPSKVKPGQNAACNVSGGSAKQSESGAAVIVNGTGAHEAIVKSFNPNRGYGFLEYQGAGGVDGLFFHGRACKGSYPQAGDKVKFDIEESTLKPGQMQATNITGGTQPLGKANAKGNGKGGKGGPYDMMSMMMSMMGMMMGGKGKGKGKGK